MRISDWSSDVCSSDLENGLKAEPADIRGQGGPHEFGEARAVPGVELRSPVDIGILGAGLRLPGGVGRDQDEPFLEQRFDLQARAALRGIHDTDVVPEIGRASWRESVCQYV